ncbi:MAG: hypothetical protein EOM91_05810 [Sphingobacteriia bacterium]|nr:hypothetical protein [Sphingobacteriia bacterium]NCC40294.1 hypothetical protein [Gammaproteobacteria bacterium]
MAESGVSKTRSRESRRHRRLRRRVRQVALGLTVALVLGAILYGVYALAIRGFIPLNQHAEEWFEARGEQTTLIELPRDDADHDTLFERWRYRALMSNPRGDEFTLIAQVNLLNEIPVQTLIQVSLTDEQTGRRFTDEKRIPVNSTRGIRDGFRFSIGDWRIEGGGGKDRLRVVTDDFSFDLRLSEGAAPIPQGDNGRLDFGEHGQAQAYARARMPINGVLRRGDMIEVLNGHAWFDHVWGPLDLSLLGRRAFAITLDDGMDLLLEEPFEHDDRPMDGFGTWTRDGLTSHLRADDFKISSTAPSGWTIVIPALEIALEVSPITRGGDLEGDAGSRSNWEGAVEIGGSHRGRGFAEIKGGEPLRR